MAQLILAGATGLIGSEVLDLASSGDDAITTVGRRATGRVDNEIIWDFDGPVDLPTAQTGICALGTTIATAGSREAFRAIDHDAVIAFAEAVREAGAEHFVVVTAVDANPGARVFYSKVKGETEAALETLGFTRLDIIQPGLLLGARGEFRPVERFLQRADPLLRCLMIGPLHRYAGIRATTVAGAILALTRMTAPGIYRHENRDLENLAGTR